MKRRRICIVVTTRLPVRFFLVELITALAQKHEVTLIVNTRDDVYVEPLKIPAQIIHVGIERKISLWRDLIALLQLFLVIRRYRFDVVQSITPKAGLLGMLAAAAARIPKRIHYFQGEVWLSRKGFMRLLLKATDRITARLATHVLAVSQSERAILDKYRVVEERRVTVLGGGSICGVDLERYKPDQSSRRTLRKELGISEGDVVILYVGRLTADKGVIDLGRAFRVLKSRHDRIRLVFVGPDEENIATRIREASGVDGVSICGYARNPERFMAAADILCLPSYREGFGIVLIEAAAVGIPTVGSRIPGIVDAMEEGVTGTLFDPGNVEELIQKLESLIKNPELRDMYGHRGRERVREQYSQASVLERYTRYVEEVVLKD